MYYPNKKDILDIAINLGFHALRIYIHKKLDFLFEEEEESKEFKKRLTFIGAIVYANKM